MTTTTTFNGTIDRQTWLRRAAKAGYLSRGVLYLLVGGLAVAAAFGAGAPEGSKGALASLADEVYGKLLLGLVALGFAGFALWRFFQAIMDADNHGTDRKGLAIRAGFVGSAIAHVLLAGYAGSFLWGGGSSGEDGTESFTACL